MQLPERWTKGPRPDPEVGELIAALRKAYEDGQLRSLAVVTVNPMLKVETSAAGDHDDEVRKQLLASGLIKLSNTLLK